MVLATTGAAVGAAVVGAAAVGGDVAGASVVVWSDLICWADAGAAGAIAVRTRTQNVLVRERGFIVAGMSVMLQRR